MVHILREMLKKKGPSFRQRIGYPANIRLQTPQELLLSMRWILSNLVDKFDDPEMNKCEWYDFIWSTFRALRRKVTQFQLNDLEAVYMLEICTRFHIFSVHSMCEMAEHGFVEHLNFENLSKCLITLNQLYNDLNQREIYCANEAEFRSYHALFFHDSDLQRNVFRLDPVIRRTSKLQFSLECILALNSKNYIKFFNLVREADYLTACLLFRQFHDVRQKAFLIMNKSHKSSDYRKADLIKHLGFEDELDLERFCDYMGVEYKSIYVNFDPKNNCHHNRRRPRNILCKSLIESKRRDVPLSEILAGGKFVFEANELDYLGPGRSNYSFNTDDDVVYEDDLVPTRRWAESIVAEQMWKSIFFCVVGERIVDSYERLYPQSDSCEISKSEVSNNEYGPEHIAKFNSYVSSVPIEFRPRPERVFESMIRIRESLRRRAAARKAATKRRQTSYSPKASEIIKGTINNDIVGSRKSVNEEASRVFYKSVIEESAQEAVQDTNDSASEAIEQATATGNVDESVGEVVAESENSSSFENADLKPPVKSNSVSPTDDECKCEHPEFEARALASIMSSVLRVVRKRGGRR